MNKPNILLYSISAQFYSSFKGNKCIVCDLILDNTKEVHVIFDYYDYIKQHNHEFNISFCPKCFTEKIEGKSLKSLTNFIPLLKIKGKKPKIKGFYYEPKNGILYIFDEEDREDYDYLEVETDEVVDEFTQRAKEYHK